MYWYQAYTCRTRAWVVQEVSSPNSLLTHLGDAELILGRNLQTIPLRSAFCFLAMMIRLSSVDPTMNLEFEWNGTPSRYLPMMNGTYAAKTTTTPIGIEKLRHTVLYSVSMHSLNRLSHTISNFQRLIDVERLRQGQSMTQQALNLFIPQTELDRRLFRTKVLPLLEAFRPMKASDPRDKIYACVPMVLPSGHTAMRPDYSLSLYEVYAQVVKDFIRYEGTLTILSSCDAEAVDLPSFVPDWRVPTRTLAFSTYVDERNECIYQAATVKAASAKVTKGSTSLRDAALQRSEHRLGSTASITRLLLITSGVLVDHITTISPPYAESRRFRRQRWEAILSTLPNYYSPTHELLTCAYQRLLVGDIYGHGSHNVWYTKLPILRKFVSSLEFIETEIVTWLNCKRVDNLTWNFLKMFSDKDPRFVQISRRGARADPTLSIKKPWTAESNSIFSTRHDTINELDERAARAVDDGEDHDTVLDTEHDLPAALFDPGTEQLFRAILSQITSNRALGVTKSGYLALLPKGARIGDCIVVLDGGPVPFVLRSAHSCEASSRLAHGGQRWSLVGEAYVHGLMDGEVATLSLENRGFVPV